MKFRFIFWVLYLLALATNAQKTIVLQGKIVDINDKKPIGYVSISVCEKAMGSISNEFGEFKLTIQEDSTLKLCISAIGYKTFEIQIGAFKSNESFLIQLEPQIHLLNEFTVIGKKANLSARKIVKKAIEKIPSNYPIAPHQLNGYYRDYIKYDSLNYVNLMEAALSIHDQGYLHSDELSLVELLALRRNSDIKRDKTLEIQYKNNEYIEKGHDVKYLPGYIIPSNNGNEYKILSVHNPIRKYNEKSFAYLHVLQKDFVRNHVFKLDSITYLNNRELYVISFSFVNNKMYQSIDNKTEMVDVYKIHGVLYVDVNAFSIVKLVYTNLDNYEIVIDYQRLNSKMYLNYISFSNTFIQTIPDTLYEKYILSLDKTPPKIKSVVEVNPLQLKVYFNKPLEKISAETRKNYALKLDVVKGKVFKIKPSKIDYIANDTMVILNFSNPVNNGSYKLNINGVKDLLGNTLGDPVLKKFTQYRELFINAIQSNPDSSVIKCPMDMTKPLYEQKCINESFSWENYNVILNQPLK